MARASQELEGGPDPIVQAEGTVGEASGVGGRDPEGEAVQEAEQEPRRGEPRRDRPGPVPEEGAERDGEDGEDETPREPAQSIVEGPPLAHQPAEPLDREPDRPPLLHALSLRGTGV